MSKLLVKPSTPDAAAASMPSRRNRAGWTYVGFDVYRLESGQSLRQDDGRPRGLPRPALRQGARRGRRPRISATIGGRSSPFEPDPWSVYVPARSDWSLDGRDAIARSPSAPRPAEGKLPARVIAPDQVGQETRGKGTNTRHVAQHPARDRAGRKPARGRGHHAGRPLVELSAAQARPRRAAGRIAAGGDLLPPPQPARRALPSSASTRTTARLDETLAVERRRRGAGAARATIRSARRTATSSIIST